jgi:hypothetical protein
MNAAQILETLSGLGVTVRVIGPDRIRLEPASKIPDDLLPRIREAKPDILAVLKAPPPRQVERECWHCRGKLRCPCIACAEGLRAGDSGPCVICKGAGKVPAWIQ